MTIKCDNHLYFIERLLEYALNITAVLSSLYVFKNILWQNILLMCVFFIYN